jgi:hypothetical protein
VAAVIALIWGHARRSTTLRDNLVPHRPPGQQPYSLGRWQMLLQSPPVVSNDVPPPVTAEQYAPHCRYRAKQRHRAHK